jgi:hypothetical protein
MVLVPEDVLRIPKGIGDSRAQIFYIVCVWQPFQILERGAMCTEVEE